MIYQKISKSTQIAQGHQVILLEKPYFKMTNQSDKMSFLSPVSKAKLWFNSPLGFRLRSIAHNYHFR